MNTKKTSHPEILMALAQAKTAYEKGLLCEYKPLEVLGVGYQQSTRLTSWGPMMKK